MDIWEDGLLKKFESKDYKGLHIKLLRKKNETASNKSKYQVFEVLICETLSYIYPDFKWCNSPVSIDNGVDFKGEKEVFAGPYAKKGLNLCILGQVKRFKNNYGPQKIIADINKMEDFYIDYLTQQISLYKIMHVVSSDKQVRTNINDYLKKPSASRNRYYVIDLVDANEFFIMWGLNKQFLNNVLPSSLDIKARNAIKDYFQSFCKNHLDKLTSSIKYNLAFDYDQHANSEFIVNIKIQSDYKLPLEIVLDWKPSIDNNIYLVKPNLLCSNKNSFRTDISSQYNLDIVFKSSQCGICNLGHVRLKTIFGDVFFNIPLGNVNIVKSFNMNYYEKPNSKYLNEMRKSIITPRKFNFYSIVGEGGIGKTTFIHELNIFAINNSFVTIELNHGCLIYDDLQILKELITKLMTSDSLMNQSYNLIESIKSFTKNYYQTNWTPILMSFIETNEIEDSQVFLECITCILAIASTHSPIMVSFSNMHWASSKLLIILELILKNIKEYTSYFGNSIIIIFEGRTNEILPMPIINNAREWNVFANRQDLLYKITLNKWAEEDCKLYLRQLFVDDLNDKLKSISCNTIIDKLIKYSSGNPMHIKEMVHRLIEQGIIEISNNNRLNLLNPFRNFMFSENIIDTINLRIAYYKEKHPDIIDALIIFSVIDNRDFDDIYHIIVNKLSKKYLNLFNILNATGFVNCSKDSLSFMHEHYRYCFENLKVENDEFISELIKNLDFKNYSSLTYLRILLAKNSPDYNFIADNLKDAYEKEADDLIKHKLLQLFEALPTSTLVDIGLPKYYIYKLLTQSSMSIGSWDSAIIYTNKVIKYNLQTPDYFVSRTFLGKNLANILGLMGKIDDAILVALDTIKSLENYMNSTSLIKKEHRSALEREHALLYNRLAIEYHMVGLIEESDKNDIIALKLANEYKDDYTENKVMYEQGLHMAVHDCRSGEQKIEQAINNLKNLGYLKNQQKHDLIIGNLYKVQLKKLSFPQYYKESDLLLIHNDSKRICSRLSTQRETFESFNFHQIYGTTFVAQSKFDDAINCFGLAATIAERASLVTILWKAYLNLAQVYIKLGNDNPQLNVSCKNKAKLYAGQAKTILYKHLNENVEHYDSLLVKQRYPISVADNILSGKSIITPNSHISYLFAEFGNCILFL